MLLHSFSSRTFAVLRHRHTHVIGVPSSRSSQPRTQNQSSYFPTYLLLASHLSIPISSNPPFTQSHRSASPTSVAICSTVSPRTAMFLALEPANEFNDSGLWNGSEMDLAICAGYSP